MNQQELLSFVNERWGSSIIPTLQHYIQIPNKSPGFDPDWQAHGYMDKAVALLAAWCQEQNLTNMKLSVHQEGNHTPLLMLEIQGQTDQTVMLYGHLDKQPEMTGWDKDLGPWKPVLRDDRLYGRGGADDGYAVFAALTAIKALQVQNIPHARCIILIEASEESGSHDLPYYMEQLQDQIGTPDLIVCLDSGCGNYEQFWGTTSLRGMVKGHLRVDILSEGVHSGAASGVVASSFRIARQLLSRIEDPISGKILLDELKVTVPEDRVNEAHAVAVALGEKIWTNFPFVANAKPVNLDHEELILNRSWRAALAITGVDGIPALKDAGNVLRPQTTISLSMRIPPTCDPHVAGQALKKTLEQDPPYGAEVTFSVQDESPGWNAPAIKPWLAQTLQQASQDYFGKPALYWGEGGSIPFMGMLGKRYPQAQFVITGVLGPRSNAHGPNEFLHIPTAKKLTCCIATVLTRHFQESASL